jgi:pyruvate dehydrogenase E2 component (dihydrolipoamide acetyltransferase)
MATIVRMPEVLANASEAALQTWLVKEGDSITIGQPIAEIETEKAIVEYSAEVEGTMVRLVVGEGDSVVVGAPIGVIAAPGESGLDVERLLASAAGDPPASTEASEDSAPATVSPRQAATVSPEPAATVSPEPAATVSPEPAATESVASAAEFEPAATAARSSNERLFASPLVRRLARERDVDLTAITGSGPGGRIVRRDLERMPAPAVATPSAGAPVLAEPATGNFSDIPHTGMRRAIARRLTESKSTVPHFYVVADCRVDALLDLRRKVNEASERKVSVNDFIVKAVAKALIEVPEANVIWTDEASRRFNTVDLAVAVSTDGGLLTPVLRGVERMGVAAISETIGDLAQRARSGKLKQHELEGGSFAISNLGMFGVDEFSAILNPPQSGILAVGAAKQRAVVEDGAVVVGSVMTVTLSADHRVVDGALAATWLAAFVRLIENPLAILL